MKRRRRAQHPAFQVLKNFSRQREVLPKIQSTPSPATPEPLQDQELFKQAIAGTVPLAPLNKADIPTPKPQPIPRQRQQDESNVLQEALTMPFSFEDWLEIDTEASYLRPGVPRHVLTDLRKNRWITQTELDLHGLTRDEAQEALAWFLAECQNKGTRCVRIIHGKGLSSPGKKPVLKSLARYWLTRRDNVLAFCQAPPHDGGEGALLVLLKSQSLKR